MRIGYITRCTLQVDMSEYVQSVYWAISTRL